MNSQCEICAFNNPRGTATAVIIRNGKLLLLKRAEEPFKGMLDFPGGYMSEGESPDETLLRELKEELGVDARLTFIKAVPGSAAWKGKNFAVISFFYLADIGDQPVVLNDENSGARWVSITQLDAEAIAFDSNRAMAAVIKEKFNFDFARVRELVRQLDPSAIIHEDAFYGAVLNGHVARVMEGEKLIGMGWIFPRQTALRKQAVVEDMIVDEAYRGRGLGRVILRDLLKWAKENGVEVVELTTNPKRIAANELYKSEGFELHPTNHYLYKVK